jgi:hypothetical protein
MMHIPDNLIKHWANLSNNSLSAQPTLVGFGIANGKSLSKAVRIPAGMRGIGLLTPASWTNCTLSMQISFDNSTFYEMCDSTGGTAQLAAITDVVGGISFYFSVWNMFRAPYLKVRSGTLASPTTQEGDRVLNLICVNCNAADH